jgi:hypothetical protein
MQMPAWQVSFCVQGLPASQAVPSGFGGLVQAPVASVQTPAEWHGSSGAQTTGGPLQMPA